MLQAYDGCFIKREKYSEFEMHCTIGQVSDSPGGHVGSQLLTIWQEDLLWERGSIDEFRAESREHGLSVLFGVSALFQQPEL
jgi:hypothetical protein